MNYPVFLEGMLCLVLFAFASKASNADDLAGYSPVTAGTVTINVYAANLRDRQNSLMPEKGLAFLAVDTLHNGFSEPDIDAFFTAPDDFILAKWDLTAIGPGQLADTTAAINLSSMPSWDAQDPVCLYWYPSLNKASLNPGNYGISYGQYRHDIGLDGSSPWTTPSPGATIDLKFFTDDILYDGSHPGSNPSSAAQASMTVVPEPTYAAAISGTICLLWAVLKPRQRKATPSTTTVNDKE